MIDSGYLRWEDWSHANPRSIHDQIKCYRHGHTVWESQWAIHTDIDEYVVAVNDTEPGFLVRAIDKLAAREKLKQKKPLGLISLPNIGFIGMLDKKQPTVLQFTHWRTQKEMNHLI